MGEWHDDGEEEEGVVWVEPHPAGWPAKASL